MAAVCGAFVVTPKLDHHIPSTPLDLIGIRFLPMNNGTRSRGLFQKARCELSGSGSGSNTPNDSALNQLKNSAFDRYTRERSSIVVIGLSFHTAPIEMREKLAIPVGELSRAIVELCRLNHIPGNLPLTYEVSETQRTDPVVHNPTYGAYAHICATRDSKSRPDFVHYFLSN